MVASSGAYFQREVNIVALVPDIASMENLTQVTGMMLFRIVGIFIPPLGAILGWFF